MWFYALSLLIIVLDQATKKLMSVWLPLCEPGNCQSVEILPVFQFMLLHNEGAAFSFLSDAGGWQRWFLVFVSTSVSAVIAVWLYRVMASQKILSTALALILGGAIGNLIDRAVNGYVVDFILVHYEDWYFPAFNIADSAISVGAAVLIIDMFFFQKPENAGDE